MIDSTIVRASHHSAGAKGTSKKLNASATPTLRSSGEAASPSSRLQERPALERILSCDESLLRYPSRDDARQPGHFETMVGLSQEMSGRGENVLPQIPRRTHHLKRPRQTVRRNLYPRSIHRPLIRSNWRCLVITSFPLVRGPSPKAVDMRR